jgi:hypothetical protein
MTRASNEAETGRPTLEQEMASFKGFSTNNGETITPETPEDLNPVAGKNQSAAEIVAAAAKAGATKEKPAGGAKEAPKPDTKLTDAESEAAIAALDTKLGREANETEIADALKAATAVKNGKEPAKKSVQDRINKATRAQRNAERERDAARAELAAERASKAAPLTDKDKGGKDAAVTADEAPDPKKFEYGELDANYIRALARYEAKQEIADAAKNQQKTQLTAQQQADKEKFDAAKTVFEDKGSELYDDFDEVVMQGARDKAWPLSDTLGAVLITSEYGAQIAYELAYDPKEAKRIFELAPMRQVAWLGRKEAALEASAGSGASEDEEGTEGTSEDKPKPAAKTVPKVSKAPAPITRARGQGSASTTPGDTNDFAAFEAAAMGRKT